MSFPRILGIVSLSMAGLIIQQNEIWYSDVSTFTPYTRLIETKEDNYCNKNQDGQKSTS